MCPSIFLFFYGNHNCPTYNFLEKARKRLEMKKKSKAREGSGSKVSRLERLAARKKQARPSPSFLWLPKQLFFLPGQTGKAGKVHRGNREKG